MHIFDIINLLKEYGSLEEFCNHYSVVSATSGSERVCVVLLCCRKDLDMGKKKAALWRQELQEKDLLEHINVMPIVGNNEMEPVFCLVDGALEIKCNDFYEGVPEKLLGAFLYVLLATQARTVIKIDVNVSVVDWTLLWEHTQRYEQTDADLIGFIRDAAHGIDRFWHFGKCNSETWNNRKYTRPAYCWPDGGRGYLMKRPGLKKFSHISVARRICLKSAIIYMRT